jgi:hypothetical protein
MGYTRGISLVRAERGSMFTRGSISAKLLGKKWIEFRRISTLSNVKPDNMKKAAELRA